jgi:hypothetical protein
MRDDRGGGAGAKPLSPDEQLRRIRGREELRAVRQQGDIGVEIVLREVARE